MTRSCCFRSLKNWQSELFDKDVGFLDSSMLKVGSCVAHDKSPLVFIVLECLLQDVDGEKCHIDGLPAYSISKLNRIKNLQHVRVFNWAAFDARGQHLAGLEAPVAFRGLSLQDGDEGRFLRGCCILRSKLNFLLFFDSELIGSIHDCRRCRERFLHFHYFIFYILL